VLELDRNPVSDHAETTIIVGRWPRSPKRIVLAALGVACVGLAFAGVFVPGLPTTVFLIAASYLLARSCPWLEERLLRSRWFKPYLPFVDGRSPLPARARWVSAGMMWIAVAISLAATRGVNRVVPVALLAAAVVGTWFIFRFRRDRSAVPAP